MAAAGLEHAIASGAAELRQSLPEGAAARLATLIAELARWNRRINLTAIRDSAAMVAAHVLDSLSVRPLLQGRMIIDVGTGAGFPGLPLAIAEPARRVTLIDGNGKKISFVQHMIGELGLHNAEAVRTRAERYAPAARFDTVVARALAPLPRLIDLAGHLLDDDGVLLALKGQYPAAELAELEVLAESWDYEVTELTVPALAGHARHAVTLRRRREPA